MPMNLQPGKGEEKQDLPFPGALWPCPALPSAGVTGRRWDNPQPSPALAVELCHLSEHDQIIIIIIINQFFRGSLLIQRAQLSPGLTQTYPHSCRCALPLVYKHTTLLPQKSHRQDQEKEILMSQKAFFVSKIKATAALP